MISLIPYFIMALLALWAIAYMVVFGYIMWRGE